MLGKQKNGEPTEWYILFNDKFFSANAKQSLCKYFFTYLVSFFLQLLCITMSGSSIYRNIDSQAITKGDGTQKDLLL